MGQYYTQNMASIKEDPSPGPPSSTPPRPTIAKVTSRRAVATPAKTNLKSSQILTPDPIIESTAVQRLVEYFVVLTSVPRWENEKDNVDHNNKNRNSSSNNDVDASAPPTSRKIKRRGFRKDRKKLVSAPDASMPDVSLPEAGIAETNMPEANPRDENEEQSQGQKTSGNIHLPDDSPDYTFSPKITARYPTKDHSDNPLNPMISHFCYPTGDVIVPLKSYEMPRVHHFVLTNDKGRKVYGTCLTILEEYYPDEKGPWGQRTVVEFQRTAADTTVEVSLDTQQKALYLPKVLCLLSTWPYLTAFREYLSQLYRLATATNVMSAPIERYVVNVCMEIPAPPPGAHEIHVNILNSTIRFWAPPAKLPIAYVALPYETLFECLDVEHILTVWSAMITERKILLVSSQYSILTICAEILCSLLFPMRWSHLYIPLLPRMLCPMLGAPVPYLCGIARENLSHAEEDLADDTIVVDLDKNRVSFGRGTLPVPQPPVRRWNKLRTRLEESVGALFWKARGLESEYKNLLTIKPHKRSLQRLRSLKPADHWVDKLVSSDHAFNLAYTPGSNVMDSWSDAKKLNESGQTQWDVVQEAFLRFFVDVLKKYRKHLVLPSPNRHAQLDRPSFDHVSFLAAQPSQAAPFLSELCMTQQFDDWITRRLYYPGEPDLVFFDQSIDDKLNRSKIKMRKKETPLLQSARAQKVLTTVKAVPPDKNTLPWDRKAPFIYEKWPSEFNERYFNRPRPIPKMIAAEFDRQAVLVERLRAERETDDDEDIDNQFHTDDFDSLPEVAAFMVFFFVYSALVGLDWQAYEAKRREEASKLLSEEDESQMLTRSQEVILANDPNAKFLYVDPFDTCTSCPEESAAAMSSTFSILGEGAGEVYQNLFLQTATRIEELRRMVNPTFGIKNVSDMNTEVEKYEEAIESANAQLDLGFEVLGALLSRGLNADLDTYKSLMQACGRCRNTEKAIELTKLIREHSHTADSETLSIFVSAFAAEVEGDMDVAEFESPREEAARRLPKQVSRSTGSPRKDPFPWLSKNVEMEKGASSDESVSLDSTDSHESSVSSFGFGFEWLGNARPKRGSRAKRKKRKKSKKLEQSNSTRYRPLSRFVKAQVELGESLLDFLYPDLKIETDSNACPYCSYSLSESETVLGWVPRDFQNYTTECPNCKHRFVPNFSVSCSSPTFEGSQGKQSVLFCELLSPWVLRKALGYVVNGETGILGMLEPEWRSGIDIRATLFWNLIVLCRRYRLPFGFLLQGSVQGRMILPRPPKSM